MPYERLPLRLSSYLHDNLRWKCNLHFTNEGSEVPTETQLRVSSVSYNLTCLFLQPPDETESNSVSLERWNGLPSQSNTLSTSCEIETIAAFKCQGNLFPSFYPSSFQRLYLVWVSSSHRLGWLSLTTDGTCLLGRPSISLLKCVGHSRSRLFLCPFSSRWSCSVSLVSRNVYI